MRNQTAKIVLGVVVLAIVGGVVGWALAGRGGEEGASATPVPTQAPETQPTAEPTGAPGAQAPPQSATITNIELRGGKYVVHFTTQGFEPRLDETTKHVHFFWNTVLPAEAGVPRDGPWDIWPNQPGAIGTSPFAEGGQLTEANRPPNANEICVLVANFNHSVIPNTGNCTAI